MIARATPDVAATIGWLGENEVVVAQLSGDPKSHSETRRLISNVSDAYSWPANFERGNCLARRFVDLPSNDHLERNGFQPPAMAPMTKNGSARLATAPGNGESGDSCDRSSSHA
jgi:hypothetical protein